MKERFEQLLARIDALTLRERIIVFVSTLAVLFAAADTIWLSPAMTQQKQLSQRLSGQNAELDRLRAELASVGSVQGPAKAMREELSQVQQELAQAQLRVAQLSSVSGADAAPLSQILVHFLRRHEGLTLVRTSTLQGNAAGPKGSDGSTLAGLNRQGLELTVSGPYLELIRYVQTLERALPTLRWGVMKLDTQNRVPQLTLEVSMLEVRP